MTSEQERLLIEILEEIELDLLRTRDTEYCNPLYGKIETLENLFKVQREKTTK